MRAEWVTAVLLGGCYHPAPPGDVPCAENGDCPRGLQCDHSVTPATCVDHAGEPQDAASDVSAVDAAPDAPSDSVPPPTFVAEAHANSSGVASLTYTLTIPSGVERFALVSVQLGSDCTALVPGVTSVTYGGVALTRITTITGTPCGMTTTRSDQWQLIAPPDGPHDVEIVLDGTADTVHSGALAFVGINQTTPVRASAIARGSSTSSSVDVSTAPGDLVVNTVGQGTKIDAPGTGQIARFTNNASGHNTLDNSAASTVPATGMSQTMTWTFIAADEWQTISSSLEP